MQHTMLYAKFHRVTLTRALNTVGSVTIDRDHGVGLEAFGTPREQQ